MDEIVSLILSPRWKSLSFFSVVLKKQQVMGVHTYYRIPCSKLEFDRPLGCLTGGSLPRFDLSDDCVRAVGETGDEREEKVKQEMETRKKTEEKKKIKKVATHQILLRLRLLLLHLPPPIFPPIRSPRKIKRKEERQQWRWREAKVFFFSFKEGGPAPLKPWAWQVQSHRLLSLTASHTPPPPHSLFLDVLGSGNATRWKIKKRREKSIPSRRWTNYLLIKI